MAGTGEGSFPQLPAELIRMICNELWLEPDVVRSMRLVCRQFEAVASEHVFKDMIQTISPQKLRTLKAVADSRHARYVKSVNLMPPGDRNHPADDEQVKEQGPELQKMIEETMSKFTSLESVHLRVLYTSRTSRVVRDVCMQVLASAFRHRPAPTLRKFIFGGDIGEDMRLFHSIINQNEDHRASWAATCAQIRVLDIDQSIMKGNRFTRVTSTEEGVAQLNSLLQAMPSLQDLAVCFNPHQTWPDGGNYSFHLKSLTLNTLEPHASDLAGFVKHNREPLEALFVTNIHLVSGFWEQVYVALCKCKRLKTIDIEETGYSGFGSDEVTAFQTHLQHGWEPLWSLRYADHSALRDLAVATIDTHKTDRFDLAAKAVVWRCIIRQFPSLEDYRTLAEWEDRREADSIRAAGVLLDDDDENTPHIDLPDRLKAYFGEDDGMETVQVTPPPT